MLTKWYTFIACFTCTIASSNMEERSSRAQNILNRVARTASGHNCPSGWYSYEDKCFKTGGITGEKLSWEAASLKCSKYGGDLVSIHSKEQQDFLTHFLLLKAECNLWIGLHDRIKESNYEWDDSSVVNFTNWWKNEPSGPKRNKEDCVEMVFVNEENELGKWNDVDCNTHSGYICQIGKDSKNNGKDPKICSPPLQGGYSFKKSCFYFVNETKSWEKAEVHCSENYAGHLIAIKDLTVQKFLDYILKENRIDTDLWIGIKIKPKQPLLWTSGWHVVYSMWEESFKEETVESESCVSRLKSGHWDVTGCEEKLGFICEVSVEKPPVLKKAPAGAVCPFQPPVWKDLGGEHCYYFDTRSSLTWHQSNFECMRRGSTLVSMSSQEETDTLEQFFRYSQRVLWIGLFRQMPYADSFRWADGSELIFQNWQQNEPSSKSEPCVELNTRTMEWNDISCDKKRGFICKTLKILPNVTYAPQPLSCSRSLSISATIGVVFCILFVLVLIIVCIYNFRPWDRMGNRDRKHSNVFIVPSPMPGARKKENELVIKEDTDYVNSDW